MALSVLMACAAPARTSPGPGDTAISASVAMITTTTVTTTTVTTTTSKPDEATTTTAVTTTTAPTPPTTATAPALAAATRETATNPAVRSEAPRLTGRTSCEQARADVEAAGLRLPSGFEYRCPGNTESFPGQSQAWGVTCYWNAYYCPSGAYIAINPAALGWSETRLRYTVAHETCHALDYVAGRAISEPAADACAAAYGFPPR